MILTIDIGNTSITCGVYEDITLVKKFRMPSDTELTVQDYGQMLSDNLGDMKLSGAIIASVVGELNNRIQYAVLSLYGVKAAILSENSKMPITLALKNNAEIGADRIANGARAYEIYKKPVIVVDFGTATTFDIVNGKGEFVGGIIAPGIGTQLSSLGSATEKLPSLEAAETQGYIGNCTKDAILSGVIRGTACMIDGMLENCIRELGEQPVIVATGGFCEIISKYTKNSFDSVIPELTLEGLRDLFPLNKPIQPVYNFRK
ncbi:MAG: type III pantothenate kinase [Cyanobacteria bacterium RUI128]|nr:type III pantothenate kinase [Cyanobacteria bacterium RUI128]